MFHRLSYVRFKVFRAPRLTALNLYHRFFYSFSSCEFNALTGDKTNIAPRIAPPIRALVLLKNVRSRRTAMRAGARSIALTLTVLLGPKCLQAPNVVLPHGWIQRFILFQSRARKRFCHQSIRASADFNCHRGVRLTNQHVINLFFV
jgi:hypothetical protein